MNFKLSIVFCMFLCMVNTPNYYSQVTIEQTGEDKYVRVMLFEGDVYDGFLIEITLDPGGAWLLWRERGSSPLPPLPLVSWDLVTRAVAADLRPSLF